MHYDASTDILACGTTDGNLILFRNLLTLFWQDHLLVQKSNKKEQNQVLTVFQHSNFVYWITHPNNLHQYDIRLSKTA